jgi:hypothetical protein
LEFLPDLTASRGKLLSRQPERGRPVYAATFIPQRRIVLEEQLCDDPSGLRLILIHEILHFAWLRLGNRRRREFQVLLAAECAAHARGELGESADVAKEHITEHDCRSNSRAWRYYACESFCDTGAWLLSGIERHPSFRLAKRWRKRRAAWFQSLSSFRI